MLTVLSIKLTRFKNTYFIKTYEQFLTYKFSSHFICTVPVKYKLSRKQISNRETKHFSKLNREMNENIFRFRWNKEFLDGKKRHDLSKNNTPQIKIWVNYLKNQKKNTLKTKMKQILKLQPLENLQGNNLA